MIRYLRHNEIDKKKWDAFLASSPQRIAYAFSWYLDVVSPEWDALVEEDYVSVFPLTYRKKAGINYLFQPYFTQQLGLFSKEQIITEDKLRDFLLAIPGKFKLIEIQLNTSNRMVSLNGFKTKNKLTHHLYLSAEYKDIKVGYSENLIRNLKKAIKFDLKDVDNIPFRDIIESFRKNKGSEISNLKKPDYDTFIVLLEEAEKRKLLNCIGVNNPEGKLIASAIFLNSPLSYIFLFSSTEKEAKEKGAMAFLIDNFIKNHSKENKILDFEGSMNVNLARFYKSFGSKEVVYLQILKNNLPPVIRWLK